MEVVMLDFYCMRCVAKGAIFTFTVFKSYFADMPAAAGHFYADDFTAVMEVNPVVVDFTSITVVHDSITS